MEKQLLDFIFQTLPLPTEYRLRDSRERLMELIQELLHRERDSAHRVLAMQDVIPNKLFVLATGYAKAQWYDGYHQFPFAPYLYASPAILCDWKAFYKRRNARFSIELTSHGTVYSISRADIDYIEQSYPKLEAAFRLLIKQQNTALKQYESDCRRLTAEARFERANTQRGDLLTTYYQKDVAAHIGVAPETFNRLLKRLAFLPKNR